LAVQTRSLETVSSNQQHHGFQFHGFNKWRKSEMKQYKATSSIRFTTKEKKKNQHIASTEKQATLLSFVVIVLS
jgi:hypothetical protein